MVAVNYTTENTKKLIYEALKLYKNRADFELNGWQVYCGHFKVAYIKGDVVVKFGPEEPFFAAI